MTPDRLAEIQENDRLDRQRGSVTASMAADIADHRTELLAYVDELRGDRNYIARQHADKADEYDTLRRNFEQQRELCLDHTVDLAKLEIRAEDVEAALKQALAERDQARSALLAALNRWRPMWRAAVQRTAWYIGLPTNPLPDWLTEQDPA